VSTDTSAVSVSITTFRTYLTVCYKQAVMDIVILRLDIYCILFETEDQNCISHNKDPVKHRVFLPGGLVLNL
jgi:hypothetical protein